MTSQGKQHPLSDLPLASSLLSPGEGLVKLALEYHKTVEGEYGCPGATCPGVQRLVTLLEQATRSAAQSLQAATERAERLREAVEMILAEPYGCPMCDSGKLRDATKQHWERCWFARAAVLVGKADVVCEHGTAMDIHCCGCHSGFLFDSQGCTCLSREAR